MNRVEFLNNHLLRIKYDLEIRALPSRERFFSRNLQEIDAFIETRPDQNIFYGVGSRSGGGSSEHVQEIPCLWADLDFKDYLGGETEARHRLSLFEPRPTIVVFSGGGMHPYWVLRSTAEPSDQIVAILHSIADALHSDHGVCELARMMRLPGTLNHKYEPPREVKVEEFNDNEYDLDEFEQFKAEIGKESKRKGALSPEEVNGKCCFMAHAYQNPELPEPLWYAMVSNLCRLTPGGPALCQEYSRGYPKYTQHETNEKVLHSLNNGGPHTCQWIKEQGFDCGKNCGVASPIVLLQRQERKGTADVEDEPNYIDDRHIIAEIGFPFDIFPPKFLKAVANIGEALHVEQEAVVSFMLSILSGAVGNSIRVSPKSGYTLALFLWLIYIAETGHGKSPLLSFLMQILNCLQGEESKKYSDSLEEYERSLSANRKDKNVEVPDKPKLTQYLASDCTVEALGDIFADNPRGLVLCQDEISGLILGLDQYKARGNDREHYLQLFNTGSWMTNRKTAKRFIPATGAAIVGGIQNGVMPKVFGADTFENGLLPRFLLLCAEGKPLRFSRRGIEENTSKYWQGLLARAYTIPLVLDEKGFVKPKVLSLKDKALEVWIPFHDEYNEIMPYLTDWAKVFVPKLTAYYSLKFAGLLHCLRCLNTSSGDITGLIDENTINGAIALTKFFAGQAVKALRLYEPEKDRLTEFQKRMITTLYRLRDQVKNGKLSIASITEQFNTELHKQLKHNRKQIGAMLRNMGLITKDGAQGLSFLVWEQTRIMPLFSRVIYTKSDGSDESDHKTEESNDKGPPHFEGGAL